MTSLLAAVHRYATLHADTHGVTPTPVAGVSLVCATAPSELVYDISRPLACLVLQGSKRVAMGVQVFDFSAGDSLLISADVPTLSQVTRADTAAPYLSFVLELDPAVIADLTAQMPVAQADRQVPVRVEPTDGDTTDAALRLIRLFDRPNALPVLQAQLVREMHYWLLAGRHGSAIRHLGWPNGDVRRVARAVAVLRAEFTQRLPVARLAAAAGMSLSAFHHHFRAVTSLSPLQFQKHLRLIEARRLMRAESRSASNAAFAVGYESVPQFTRDYRRLFSQSPMRDTEAARANVG